jgi:hypothetical protein
MGNFLHILEGQYLKFFLEISHSDSGFYVFPQPLQPMTKLEVKKFNVLGLNRVRYLPASSIVPQPTTLPRAPIISYVAQNYGHLFCR